MKVIGKMECETVQAKKHFPTDLYTPAIGKMTSEMEREYKC
jgi:hypothetical protein